MTSGAMEQRYIFTLLAFIGNMVNLFGRDSLRIGVLAIREEFRACVANFTTAFDNNLNSSSSTNFTTVFEASGFEAVGCGPVVWDEASVAHRRKRRKYHKYRDYAQRPSAWGWRLIPPKIITYVYLFYFALAVNAQAKA